ncbi:MAG: hypothetical protein ACPGQ5_12580 [Alphaproteobacteria bacterium]|jgi:hypothetical protein
MRLWHFLLDLYLGKRGYRASFIAYGIGFWLFGIGILLFMSWPETRWVPAIVFRTILINLGLVVLILMTYPVIFCAFKINDTTRPKSRFRRVMEPTIVGAMAPLYLLLFVSGFIKSYLGLSFLGIN